jgi:hypothetical protein
MSADAAIAETGTRQVYIDRRICSLSPDRIDIHPARSIIFLPLFTLLLGIACFPIVYFWSSSLPFWVLIGLTLAAIVLVPMSGIGLVYSIAGAHIVIDRNKQSAVLQQGYLGMGVGTEELVPFWKIDRIIVRELTPHDAQGHQDDIAQYEVAILKLSGKEIAVGTVTAARIEAKEALDRAGAVASAVAEMTGSTVEMPRQAPSRRRRRRVGATAARE